LKRTEEPKTAAEPVLAAVVAEPAAEESSAEEMPFVEVGGPRAKPAETNGSVHAEARVSTTPRLEAPAPPVASLLTRTPQGVALLSCPPASTTPPRPRVAAELVAFHQPDHLVSQQYAALFDQLVAEASEGTTAVLVFTSLTPGAGTTTSVLNIAIAGCRKHDKRIMVVDANLRRPAAGNRLGLSDAVGLRNVLEGQAALETAIHSTPVENLHILGAGTGAGPTEVAAEAWHWVARWLRDRFDLVLVDAPAWEKGGVLQAIIPAATVVYLVVDAGEAAKPEVRAATRAMARLGGRVGGLIVTQ
jgi:Mrp family chromosome partitioning ATPase